MRPIFEAVGVLILLFLILRVSLWARGRSFGLRGGLTLLNVASGSLAGLAAARLPGEGAAAPGAGLSTWKAWASSQTPCHFASISLGSYLVMGTKNPLVREAVGSSARFVAAFTSCVR